LAKAGLVTANDITPTKLSAINEFVILIMAATSFGLPAEINRCAALLRGRRDGVNVITIRLAPAGTG
jgi:hypothetical protein